MADRPENVYSSQKRLAWIASHIEADDRVLELGCGTGVMITLPLSQSGHHIVGIDRNAPSIARGRELAAQLDVDPSILQARSLEELDETFDVVVVSEVLEHLPDTELEVLLMQIADHVRRGGRLLVTVPNGFGWFEAEAWLWRVSGLGRLIQGSWFEHGVLLVKTYLSGYAIEEIIDPHPSSLDTSPHVQRFRPSTLIDTVTRHGFADKSFTGSGLFSGPVSNLLWTGLDPVTRLNNWLGSCFSNLASGLYFEFERI